MRSGSPEEPQKGATTHPSVHLSWGANVVGARLEGLDEMSGGAAGGGLNPQDGSTGASYMSVYTLNRSGHCAANVCFRS